MRRLLIASAVIMLTLPAGMCQTKFVKVPCLTQEEYEARQKAEPPLVGPSLTNDARRDVRIIGGSAKELRTWGRSNLKILGGCRAL
jgi:hypothetical protein